MNRLNLILGIKEFSTEILPNYKSSKGNEDLYKTRTEILDTLLLPLTELK